MCERERIEAQIRQIIDSETQAIALSEKLFRRGGLFSQLASNRQEREALVKTPLFQEAQRRLSDLQEKEMNEWSRATTNDGLLNPTGATVSNTRQPA